MDVDSYLENTLSDLAAIFHEMVTKIQAPIVADVGGYGAWRYQNLSD